MAHSGGYVAGVYDHGSVGRRLVRLPRPSPRRTGAAQPRHRHPARAPAQRAGPVDQAPSARLGRRARPRVDHVDVRSARAPQRLVQHRGARRPRVRVPRQLLRTDDRLDQRPRRVRPAGRRLADRPRRRHGPRRPTARTTVEVDTPDDIVVLRRTDPAEAIEWRRRVREELGERIAAGAVVTGFTREGQYVLQVVA